MKKPNQTADDFAQELRQAEELHAKLATVDRFRVNEGDMRYRSGRGREQKKVDVMIAVDMMIHTIRRNMMEAALLAGDADFTPLLNALSNEGMFVTLIHPPTASKDLLSAADARRSLTVRQVYDWLDEASQSHFGNFPIYSHGDDSHDANCQLIWQEDDGREVWLEQISGTVWASWPDPERSDRMCLRRGSWRNTRLAAWDDFRMELPEALPQGFAHL